MTSVPWQILVCTRDIGRRGMYGYAQGNSIGFQWWRVSQEPPRRSVAAHEQDARPKLSSQREADDHPEIPKPISDPYENDPPRIRELKYEIWQLWGEKRIEHRFLLRKKLWRRNWYGRRNEASLKPWAH